MSLICQDLTQEEFYKLLRIDQAKPVADLSQEYIMCQLHAGELTRVLWVSTKMSLMLSGTSASIIQQLDQMFENINLVAYTCFRDVLIDKISKSVLNQPEFVTFDSRGEYDLGKDGNKYKIKNQTTVIYVIDIDYVIFLFIARLL